MKEADEIVWRGTAYNRTAVTLMVGASVAQLLLVPDREIPLAVRVLVATFGIVLAGTFGKVTVTATSIAVDVALGFTVKSLRAIPLSTVADVRAIRVNPWRYGGWGYRWCGRRCTAIVVRRGDGLEIVRKDGRRRIVTVDDAAAGAAAIRSSMLGI